MAKVLIIDLARWMSIYTVFHTYANNLHISISLFLWNNIHISPHHEWSLSLSTVFSSEPTSATRHSIARYKVLTSYILSLYSARIFEFAYVSLSLSDVKIRSPSYTKITPRPPQPNYSGSHLIVCYPRECSSPNRVSLVLQADHG